MAIPKKIPAMVGWGALFRDTAIAQAATYGIPTALATQFNDLFAIVESTAAAAIAAREQTIRTGPVYAARNSAVANWLPIARALYAMVQNSITLTPAQKMEAGVHVRDTSPTPVPVPGSAPVLEFLDARNNKITLKLLKAAGVPGGSKPQGVRTASVFTATGPVAPPADGAWVWQGNTGKTTVTIVLPPSDSARKVWVTAAWCNPRGQAGSSCSPQAIELPASGVLPSVMKMAA